MTTHGEIIVYQTNDGHVRLDVRLTQAMMAELFGTTVPNVSMHRRNIFEEGELVAKGTVSGRPNA